MAKREIDDRLKPDAQAERKAKRTSYDLHPVVDRFSKKLGSFNLIRNAKNQREAILEEFDEAQQ
jgi:hypothetical protein